MIEERNLHQDSALKIKQKYVNKLQVLTSTNYSEASSEVIYLEMMAYLSDLMNEYINNIDNRHYYKYIKLLNLHREPVKNQKRLVQFVGTGFVYANEELLHNEYPFHLRQDMYLLPPLKNIYHDYGNGYKNINVFLNMNDGRYPLENDVFSLKMEFVNPLECEKEYCIYFGMQEVVDRNQMRSRNFHYGEWELLYTTPFGISVIEIIEDETYDFLFSGCIRFKLHEPMLDNIIYLKFKNMYYDETPIINLISINTDIIYQMKIYAKIIDHLPKNECNYKYECYQRVSDSTYQKNEITDKQDNINREESISVYQNKNIHLLSYTLKGVAKETIQLIKDAYIASIRVAVKIKDFYQELEVCDYWHDHPTKPYGCYLDKYDNTLTFGNGRDYLILPANSELIFLEFIVYHKEPVQLTTMKKKHYELNVLKEISNFCEEEKLSNLIMKLSDVFKQSDIAISEQDYITIAKTLPMSRFTFLKYLKDERLLLYDCGVAMPKSFEEYFTNYMNQFSLMNREIEVKQIVYINIDVIVKTKDATVTKDNVTKEIEQCLNQMQYDNIEKLKNQICTHLNIFDLTIYNDHKEIIYLQCKEDEYIRINSLEIQLKI